MKRLSTLFVTAALTGSLFSAGATLTLSETKSMQKDGKYLKSYGKLIESPANVDRFAGGKGLIAKPASESVQTPLLPKAPAKITESGADLYGWNALRRGEAPVGLYSIGSDDLHFLWEDEFWAEKNYSLYNGFLIDGKLYGNAVFQYYGNVYAESWNCYDFATGYLESSEEWDVFTDAPFYERMVYNPNDRHIYGIGISKAYDGGTSYLFMKAPVTDPKKAEVICEAEQAAQLVSIYFKEDENCIYGFNFSGEFVKLNLDGTYEVKWKADMEDEDINFNYYMGMIYSPVDKLVYFTPCASDFTSYIATLDPTVEGGDIKTLYMNEDEYQITFLLTQDDFSIDPLKPKAPEAGSIVFENGARSGYVDFTIPSEFMDGAPIEGEMTATALLDDEVYAEYKVKAGEQLRAEYTDISVGRHTFSVYVECNGKRSRKATTGAFIGPDTPEAPTNVVISTTGVKWDAVTKGVHNGYLDFDKLVYHVSINGVEVGTTSADHLDYAIPEDEAMQLYSATVVAECNGLESDPADSQSIVAGKPLELPVNYIPTIEQAQICTLEDTNEDGQTWIYTNSGDGFAFGVQYSSSSYDDWLWLPAISIDPKGKYLSLSFESAVANTYRCDETLGVYIGKSASVDAMTTCLVEPFKPNDGQSLAFEQTNTLFTIDEPGVYYIGFHYQSAPNQVGVYLKNIKIEDNNITDASPAQVTGLSAAPADNGVLKATVTFDMPTRNFAGDALPSDAQLTATITGSKGSVTATAAPGESVTKEIETLQGNNTIEVTASLDGFNSVATSESVYTGVYAPAPPEITSDAVSADMMSMTLSWNPVTTAFEEGGFIRPEDITYNVYVRAFEWFGNSAWKQVASNIKDCSFTYTAEEGAPMAQVYMSVEAVNEAGDCGYLAYRVQMLGTPYTLPIEETFENGSRNLSPWFSFYLGDDYNAIWNFSKISQFFDIEGVEGVGKSTMGFICNGSEGQYGAMGVPRFTTKDIDDADLTLEMYTGENCANVNILAECEGMEGRIAIPLEYEKSEGTKFSTVTAKLPAELMGKDWVQLYLNVELTSDNSIAAFTKIAVSGVTGVSLNAEDISAASVRGGKGTITVSGSAGRNVAIFNIDGKTVVNTVADSDNALFSVEKGIYIVAAGDKKAKVVVK